MYALRGRYEVEAVETSARTTPPSSSREAVADEFDLVVAFGGDGTLNEAANGLAGSRRRRCRCFPAAARTSSAACSASPST